MPALFVTATGTDVGKTHVACALIRALRANGRPVDAFKPVLSGFDGPDGSDAVRLLEALDQPVANLDRMSPLRFRAPLAPPSAAREEGCFLQLEDLARLCLERLAETEELLLIEGAGGIMSPLAEGATNLDLADTLRCPVLLVTGSYLGAVSHTLTAIEVIRARGLDIAAIVISESEEGPPLPEIRDALSTFARDLPVAIAPRNGDWNVGGLTDLLKL